jgi:thiol-disulfide isomerase/thioredoxin
MNKTTLYLLTVLIYLLTSCSEDYTSKKYLNKVLVNLNNIESASYNTVDEGWVPGDTAAYAIYQSFFQEFNNPKDTTIGAKYLRFEGNDTSIINFCYDGEKRAVFFHEHEGVMVDSFKVRKLPFRPVKPPFFNYTKSIIEYAISTNDSILLEVKDLENTVFLKLTINEENNVEFFGKAIHMPLSPYSYDNTSIFEIWINKEDNLPYKVRREMTHDISVTTCENYELNKLNNMEFLAEEYFPDNYEIRAYKIRKRNTEKHPLINNKAPDWRLKSTSGNFVSLSDFKNKITLIQFTSVSCGPCKASIPFLKTLSTEYNQEKFSFVSIECTCENSNALKRYMDRNNFDYKFLLSTKEVRDKYSIQSFPVFFILDDKQRVIEVINGYSIDNTDNKIKQIIDNLI